MIYKTCLLHLFAIVHCVAVSAQQQNQITSTGQRLAGSKFSVDLFYGGPNLISLAITAASLDNSTVTKSGFGPVGIRAEYFFTPNISVGAEIHHARSGYRRRATELNINFDGRSQTFFFQDELIIDRTRIYPRVAYHFGKDNLQAFCFVAIGYASWKTSYRITENTLNYFTGKIPPITAKTYPGIAARAGIGFRYFFTPRFGLNADLALGGPLLTGGLSARF